MRAKLHATIGTNWSEKAPYTQTINVEGITATDHPMIFPTDEACEGTKEFEAFYDNVTRITTIDGGIVVHSKKPIDIPIDIILLLV